MLRFAARRLVSMVLVLFSISVLVFLIFFATPGVDPAARIAGRNADQATLQAVRKDFGLDRPLPVQYGLMMKKLFVTRDLTSFVNRGAKVIPQVVEAAPVTLSLVIGAAVVWVVFSILIGHRRRGLPRHAARRAADDRRPDRHLDARVLAR